LGKSNGFDRWPPALLADAISTKVTDQKDLTEASGEPSAFSCQLSAREIFWLKADG
jgi:hypothetical protein